MNTSGARHEFYWKFPGTLKNVERVCSAVGLVLDQNALNKKDRFAVELLVREAVNNAFMHGCRENERLSFTCGMTISDEQVSIVVSDEGEGFDWRKKIDCPPPNLGESGRGLYIYGLYADEIIFNEVGNSVSLTRILTEETKMTEIKVTQTGAQASIRLGEKLVAADVPDLKREMKRLIGDGVTSIAIDATHLTLLDSTGIGCLVAAHNSLVKLNGSLSIIQASSDIYDLLCSMRLDRHIKIIPLAPAQE